MDYIISILKNHWELIVSVLLFILSFILQLLKKRPNKVVDSISEFILDSAIDAVIITENIFKNSFKIPNELQGAIQVEIPKEQISFDKLNCAVKLIQDKFEISFPGVDFEPYRKIVIQAIEDILSTPEKK